MGKGESSTGLLSGAMEWGLQLPAWARRAPTHCAFLPLPESGEGWGEWATENYERM